MRAELFNDEAETAYVVNVDYIYYPAVKGDPANPMQYPDIKITGVTYLTTGEEVHGITDGERTWLEDEIWAREREND